MTDVEEPLSGGNVASTVVRVGDTVRRRTGPWTPTVHRFLRHLETDGYEGAPRALGIDEHGREILEFLPGVVPWPSDHCRYLGTEDAMYRVGALLQGFHRASRSFVSTTHDRWRDAHRADDALPFIDDRGTVVCHNDVAAWNLVVGPERWALIDWDFAGPRPFIWDVAYAVIGVVPITRDASALGWDEPLPTVRRMRALLDGYELASVDRDRVVDVVIARVASSYNHLRTNADHGIEPWATLWREGHGDGWADVLSYAEEHRTDWQRDLRQ
jgi:hypothetical protein